MDIQRIIGELRAERARLDEALVHLERLALTRVPRRGRPPNWRREASLTEANEGPSTQALANASRRLAAGA